MSSYVELHQQQSGGLLATDANRPHGYAGLYLQQQADAARRSYSSFNPRQAAEAATRRSYSSEHYRVVVSATDDGYEQVTPSPGHQGQGSYAAMAAAAAAAAATEATVAWQEADEYSSPHRPVMPGATGSPSPSPPRPRLDPSVSRPATTILAQATAIRAARLKQLAARQQQVQQPPPASSGAAAAARRPGRQLVLLSTVLHQAPYLYDRQRLSAVERFIDRIDAIPPRYAEAQVVFLSKNSLTSVAGLEQFRELRVLGLADNLLADPEQLEALAVACPGLEALSLEGNPVSYVPYYRSRVILALPGLKSLDGRPVTEEERGAAPIAVAAEEATMAVLLRNACEVHKMASVVQRAQLHMELFHAVHSRGAVLQRVVALGDAAAAPGGRSLSRLVDMWDYEGLLSTEERRKIRGALLREVGRMFRNLKAQQPAGARMGPMWEDAFAQVMTAQQQTTAALLDLMTQCQLATDELVRSMAAPLGHGPSDAGDGAGGAGASTGPGGGGGSGGAGGEGRGAARALLLREAEADVERHRAMRREREEVLTEFRDTAMKRARGSPTRPVLRPVLKSSLKRTSQPAPKAAGSVAGDEDDDDGAEGSDGADNEYRRSPTPSPSAPPRWQSARSSPPAPEAVERLMRARRGVVPTRASASSSSGFRAIAPPRSPEAAATRAAAAQPTEHQRQQPSRQPQSPQALARSSGAGAPSEAGSTASARIFARRPVSADRALARRRDQSQQQQQGSAPSVGLLTARELAGAGGGPLERVPGAASLAAASLLAGHRRSKSVDTAALRGRAAGGGSGRLGSTGRAPLRQRGRRSASTSPHKDSSPPLSPLERPAWRPAGGAKPGCGQARSTASPSYKAAAQAVSRAMRELNARTQEAAGTSPERVSALAVATAAATAAAAAAAASPPGSPTPFHAGLGLPDRGMSASPTILGGWRPWGHDQHAPTPGPQARRSLQDALMGTGPAPTSRSVPPSAGLSALSGGGAGLPGASRLRASSPAFAGSLGGAGGGSPRSSPRAAALAAARIDNLRRQVEASARETAWLRQVAEAASQPLPVAAVAPPPWSSAGGAAANISAGGAVAAAPPPWSQERQAPGPDQGWQGQSAAATQPPHWAGAQAGPGPAQSPYPYPDVTLRPGAWSHAAAQGAPGTSPQPQPQAPPPSLQPHRGSWPGPSPPAVPMPHGLGRMLAAEGSGAGFVELYPVAPQATWAGPPSGMSGGGAGAVPPYGYGPAHSPAGTGGGYDLVSATPGLLHHQQQQQQHPPPHPTAGAHVRWASDGSATPQSGAWYGSGVGMPPAPPPQPLTQTGAPSAMPGAEYPLVDPGGASGLGYASGPYHSTAVLQPQPHGPMQQLRLGPPPPAGTAGPGAPPHAFQPSAHDAMPPVQAPTPGESEQVTLDDFSLMRASLDVVAPNSMQPSATGTPSHAAHPDGANAPVFPFQRQGYQRPTEDGDGAQLEQPTGVVDTPWQQQQGMGGAPHEGMDFVDFHPGAVPMATPAFTLRGPPATVGTAAPTTPGATTIISVVDEGGGDGGGATRVDVEEMVIGEDSAGSKDQHIHLHIHPPPVQLPGTAGTEASTPQLFLQSAPEHHGPHHHRSAAAGPASASAGTFAPPPLSSSPADGFTASLGLLMHPGSPLHEALSAGHLVYEKIERIKPAGYTASTPNSAREVRTTTATGTVGVAAAESSDEREARSRRRGGRQQGGKTHASPRFTASGDGRRGRGRDEQPGFGYGHHAGGSGGDGESRGSTGSGDGRSGGDSYDMGSRAELHSRRTPRSGRERVLGGESSSGEDDGVDDTDLSRDDGDDDRAGDDGRDDDSGSEQFPGSRRGRGAGPSSRGSGASGPGRRDRKSPGRRGSEQRDREGGKHRGGGGGKERRDDGGARQLRDGDRERRGDQGRSAATVGEEGGQWPSEVPPAFQEQYATLQRQVAEQAARNATLADQLHRLQSLVPPQAALPPTQQELQPQQQHERLQGQGPPHRSPDPTGQHPTEEVMQRDPWTSSSLRSGAAAPPPVQVHFGPAAGASQRRPSPLRPPSAPGGPTPRGTLQSWATSFSGGDGHAGGAGGASPRVVRPISPVVPAVALAAAGPAGHSPRDSAHSMLLAVPVAPQGAPSPRASAHDTPAAGGPDSPRAGGGGEPGGGGSSQSQQIQAQLLRHAAIQEQISRLGEQLTAAGMSTATMQLPPELAATLAGLAASSSPLPPGSLRALEQQLVSLTLEKEAVERVLLQEQTEVRLLQQELGVMAQVADALEESKAQLQETRLAVAHQQHELQEREEQLEASREQAAELLTELAAERERSAGQVTVIASYFEQQFEEAHTAVVAELRKQLSTMNAGGGVQPHSASHQRYGSTRAPSDSQPDSLRTELESRLPPGHGPGTRSDAFSQPSRADAVGAGSISISSGLQAASAATQQLEVVLSGLPEALRTDLAAQIASGRASLASAVTEALRIDGEALRLWGSHAPTPAQHTASLADVLRADHALQLEALRARHAAQLEALAAERAAQPEALREEHAARLAVLRAEQEQQMEALRGEQAAQMEVLAAERATQPEAMRAEQASQVAALRAQHAKQMEVLRSEHAQEVGVLLAERASLPEAMRAEHAAQLAAVRGEHAARLGTLRADHATQMETMRASHRAQLQALLSERDSQPEALRAEHAAQLEALRGEHAKQMDALRAEHAKQVEARDAQPEALRAEHAAQLAALRAEHAKQMDVLRSELSSQIEALLSERTAASQALRDEHAAQMEAARASHASALAAQSSEHAKQMESMRSEHAKQMERLLMETASQPEVLRAGYSTQVAALRAEHAMQVEAVRSEHAAALAEKERQRAATAAAHEQQLAALRSEQAARLEELAVQARARLQRQEAEHRAATAVLAEEHDAQLALATRRLDELLSRHRQQLDELTEGNRRQLEGVARQGERMLAEARTEAARAAVEAEAAQEAALAELAGRLRAAESAEAVAVAARREGEAARAALQAQLDEALTALGKERLAASELRGRNQSLEVAEMETRRRMEKLMAPQDLGWRREMEADRLGSRFLLRRVLALWAANARLCRRHNNQVAVASELRRRRVCRQAVQHWRSAVLRTRVLRSLARGRELALMRRALVSLKSQTLQRRRKSRATSVAVAHWSVRQLSRCFEAWRQLHRMHARAAACSDPAALRTAVGHHSGVVLRAALGAWHQHVYQTQLPKTQRRRRAAHVYRRRLLRKAMAGFVQQAERRSLKRSQLARSVRRHRFSVLNRALVCWLRFLDGARRKRSLLGMAQLQWGHAVVRRWRRAATRSRALRLGMAALQASAGTRRLRACLARWRAFLLRRRQAALALRLASEHWRGALLWRCMSAWLQQAQHSAARQLHIKGMREYQRMMQAALRWQRLVELGRRQAAVVDRAVRLYRHRVLAGTQREVLRHWRSVVEGRRGLMRSTALGFVHAFLAIWRRRVLAAWQGEARRAAAQRGIEAALELRSALERNEGAMRQLSTRLQAVGEESTVLSERLKETQAEVLVLRQQLLDSEKRLAEAMEALSNTEKQLEAQGADLAVRAEKMANLEAERDLLLDRVHTLRQQVAAGEVSVASLQEQTASLQRSLAAAQGSVRELGLKMQQQAAQYEEQLLAARDEASLARREAGSLAAAAARLEQQAADSEAQLRTVRTGHEALVTSLRQELRARDAHIMALGQSQQQQRDGAAPSRPVTAAPAATAAAARPPSPAFSPRPLSARDARPPTAPVRTRSAAGAQEAVLLERRGVNDGLNNEDAARGEAVEAESDGWQRQQQLQQPREAGVRLRPLFEPSVLGPAAAAAAAAARPVDSRPWATGSVQRPAASATAATGRLGPAADPVPPRTSLLTHQPLLHNRPPAAGPVPPPPPPPQPLWPQEAVEEEEPPPAADDAAFWAQSPHSSSAYDAAAGAAALAAEAIAVVAAPSGQMPDDSRSDWPAPRPDKAAAGSSYGGGHGRGADSADGDDEDLPPPARHGGASGAFRRLQAAEAAMRATEEEFQRRRSRILGLDLPPAPANDGVAATAAAAVEAPPPQRTLSPRLPPRPQMRPAQRSVPGSSVDLRAQGGLAGAAADAAGGKAAAVADGRALRHSASDLLDHSLHVARERMEALSPGRLRSSGGGGAAAASPSWSREEDLRHPPPLSQPPPPQRRRNAATDPGDAEAAGGAGAAAGFSGFNSDGGGAAQTSQAQLNRSAELNDLTAGIVGTLTHLREALRSQNARPPQPPSRPGPQQPQGGSSAAFAATAHRTVTFGPTTPFTSSPASVASDAGGRGYSTSGGDGGGGDGGEALEATLRDLLRATAPPPLPAGAAATRLPPTQQQQHHQRRLSVDSGTASGGPFSDASRAVDATELLSRSLVSLLSKAVAGASAAASAAVAGDARGRPELPPRSGSSPSSVLAWLRDTASGESDRDEDADSLQLSDLRLQGLRRSPGGSAAAAAPAAAAAASRPPGGGGQVRLVTAALPVPERGHELYTRVGAHVASVVEEGLAEEEAANAAAVAAAGEAGRALLRRTVDTLLGEEEDYATIDADAY